MKSSGLGSLRCTTALVVLGLLSLAFSPSVHPQMKDAPANQRLALVGGTVYPAPSAHAISNRVVLIENGKIAAVGEKEKLQIPPGVETVSSRAFGTPMSISPSANEKTPRTSLSRS